MVAVRRRARTPQPPRYTQDDVVILSEQHQEPQWLREMRQQAWATYESLPMPYMEEEWRTDRLSSYQLGTSRYPDSGEWCDIGRCASKEP